METVSNTSQDKLNKPPTKKSKDNTQNTTNQSSTTNKSSDSPSYKRLNLKCDLSEQSSEIDSQEIVFMTTDDESSE
ncbi:hypothetical protein CVS40_6379 [Lucilia cuprina]|nr:hypothetical protein CVS40_6379 [Lucilia cuprina]